eukprot:3514141-Rhodomonas_salina.3
MSATELRDCPGSSPRGVGSLTLRPRTPTSTCSSLDCAYSYGMCGTGTVWIVPAYAMHGYRQQVGGGTGAGAGCYHEPGTALRLYYALCGTGISCGSTAQPPSCALSGTSTEYGSNFPVLGWSHQPMREVREARILRY